MRCSYIDRKRSFLSSAGQRVLWAFFVLGSFLLTEVSHAQQGYADGRVYKGRRDDSNARMEFACKQSSLLPIASHGDLPILLDRTPYGVPADDKTLSSKDSPYRPLIADGYIFVFQNLRGRFKSGRHICDATCTARRKRSCVRPTNQQDAYDTIDCLCTMLHTMTARLVSGESLMVAGQRSWLFIILTQHSRRHPSRPARPPSFLVTTFITMEHSVLAMAWNTLS